MEHNSPRIRTLQRQADRVAASGKRAAAEKLYRQIIEEAPDHAPAWTGLAEVVRDPAEQENAYRRALQLDADNGEALAGLARIRGEEPPPEVASEAVKPEAVDTGDPLSDGAGSNERQPSPVLEAENTPVTELQAADDHPGESHEVQSVEGVEVLYCANHPHRETHLRCNKCGKPICSSCAQPTPVGYRCPECIREHEDIFYTAKAIDYVIAAIVTFPLAFIAGWLATLLGFWSIFLGAAAGSLIGRIAFRAAGRRRGRWMPQLVAGIIMFAGILLAAPLVLALLSGRPSLGLLWTGIYLFAASGSALYQMR
jgi:tetratricopeptide (TPR) repeat protein